ncbi:MAG TPA: DUF362 domain-containing protein, partial [Nitrospira sp.]|nr:DUF362 domain-containing protein [Nitrospira sp.]
MPHIYIDWLNGGYLPPVERGFEWTRLTHRLKAGDRIAIKPNLTFPEFRKGVMTNPEALEAVIVYLKQFTDRITVCESDSGGYNRFSMDEVFARTGVAAFARRYGIQVVNMSNVPSRPIKVHTRFQIISVPLPTLLLDETDIFITMPVPKVHANTTVSLCLKNQWGVIQDPAARLKLHPYFADVIHSVNKSLPPTIAVVDGRYGLTRNGPMRGEVVDLNWVLVGDNVFYVDFVVAKIMGFEVGKISYLDYILNKEGIWSLDGVEFNTDWKEFYLQPFYMRREWTDYPGLLTFH